MLPSLSIGTRVACDGPPLGLPLKPPRVPPTPDGRPLFLRGVPDSEPLPVPGSGVSQSGRGRVGGRPLPRLRGMVSTTGGLLRPPASCSSSASCSPSSSSAPSCSTWSPSSSSSFCTTGSVISSSDTSTLTAGVEFPGQPSAWIRARMTTSCTYLLTSAVLGLRLCPFLVALLRSVRCCLVAIRTKLRYVLIASHLRASLAGTATRPSSVGISGHPAPARLSYRESIYRPATEGPRTDSKRAAPIPARLLVYMHMMGVCQILWCSKQMTRKVYKTAFNVPSLHHLHVERLPT